MLEEKEGRDDPERAANFTSKMNDDVTTLSSQHPHGSAHETSEGAAERKRDRFLRRKRDETAWMRDPERLVPVVYPVSKKVSSFLDLEKK